MVNYHCGCQAVPFVGSACKDGIYSFLQSFDALHGMCREGMSEQAQKHLPWHHRPKSHMLQHIVEDKVPLFGSPNQFWCYGDEDFVGSIKSVCAMSRHPATLEVRVAEKAMITAGTNAYENRL